MSVTERQPRSERAVRRGGTHKNRRKKQPARIQKNPLTIQLRYFQTLQEISDENTKTITLPSDIGGLLSCVGFFFFHLFPYGFMPLRLAILPCDCLSLCHLLTRFSSRRGLASVQRTPTAAMTRRRR